MQNAQSPNVIGMQMSQQNRCDPTAFARNLVGDLLPAGDVSAAVDNDNSVRPVDPVRVDRAGFGKADRSTERCAAQSPPPPPPQATSTQRPRTVGRPRELSPIRRTDRREDSTVVFGANAIA